MPGGGPFGFAGVWNRTPDGLACTIMTCPAGKAITRIHDRMPVIAQPPCEQWLDGPLQDPDTLGEQIETYTGDLEFYSVSKRVGNYRNDDESLIKPTFS